MKYLLMGLILLSFNCRNSVEQQANADVEKNIDLSVKGNASQPGFLLIEIAKIYRDGGDLVIYNKEDRDTIIYINNSKIFIEGQGYSDILEQEHLYKGHVKVESYFPEYNLFIMSCLGKTDEFYEVAINDKRGLVPINSINVKFKDFEQYILDTYPVPTEANPLRKAPNENSEIVSDYSDYTYLPVEIKGDWVKVKDDKDCYSGEAPSEVNIVGWIRWRENGLFILKVAHVC